MAQNSYLERLKSNSRNEIFNDPILNWIWKDHQTIEQFADLDDIISWNQRKHKYANI